MKSHYNIYPELEQYLSGTANEFSLIEPDRKRILQNISDYITDIIKNNREVNLIFICTQNSRRSHIAQLFAQISSYYYNFENVKCYSGGTLISAFNQRAVAALQRCGLKIEKDNHSNNPHYTVSFGININVLQSFSKIYDDKFNPKKNFAAIMVCSTADEACPYIPGADKRFSLPYNDPKAYDNTSDEPQKYDETCRLIARETMYIFSKIK